jgi:site-specific recombinase XerD
MGEKQPGEACSGGDEPPALLRRALVEQGYRPLVVEQYVRRARRFVAWLDRRSVPLAIAGEREMLLFVAEELAAYEKRHRRRPPAMGSWKGTWTAATRMLLRLCGCPFDCADDPHADLLEGYRAWLGELRSFAPLSVRRYASAAGAFLAWLDTRATTLRELRVDDIDAYLQVRAPGLKRVTLKLLGCLLRTFLRYLYAQHLIAHDLGESVWRTRVYEHERPPCGLKEEEIEAILKAARPDHTVVGRRDYAMLVLLAVYGLRASEVVQLRLEDLDWRHERLRIRHSKRGPTSDLPLLSHVGQAILAYLRWARPPTPLRQVFVRTKAPWDRPLRGDGLYQVVSRRLKRAGIHPEGKHGPHAFRHGRAVGLLRAGAALKPIGDILGHRRASTTQGYLRLQTEDLRDVALPLPRALP